MNDYNVSDQQSSLVAQNQYDFYHEHGFLVLRNVFSPEHCNKIYEVYRDHADDKYSAIINLDRTVGYIRESVVKKPVVIAAVENIFGSEACASMTLMLFKEVGSPYANQSWLIHQDNSYHGNPNGNTITFQLAVKEVTRENGYIYLYPGSHKEGVLPFEPRKSYREDEGTQPGNVVELPDKYTGQEMPWLASQGDVLLMHGNCIHGSLPNQSNQSRPLLSITYIKKGDPFLIGKNANRIEINLH